MFAGIAVAAAAVAFVANNASQPDNVDGFADVGQMFFPDFQDVGSATSLKVVDYDDDDRSMQSFAVQQNDSGLWVIPSHYDYPTEAADRLARTATSLMGIKKVAVASRSKVDWKRYGVLAPDAEGASDADQRGTRLNLADSSGNSLVDLIIGNKVPDQTRQYYVRVPEKNTTYITELDVDLSAKFSDWIQPDLLKIEPADLVSVTLDGYSIDETRGTINPGEVLKFQKQDLKTSGTWSLADLNAETEEFDTSPITSLVTNLDQLKIVDVRPKPEGLSDNMRINPVVKQILQRQMGDLGYFFGPNRTGEGERLYSNEGELLAGTDKGVQYTLYFGEIARNTGKDIEVGLDDAEADKEEGDPKGEEKADDEEPESEDGPRRYLLVKVDFNDELLGPKPVAPQQPTKPEILNEKEASGDKSAASAEPEFDEQPDDKPEKAPKADEAAAAEEDEEEATAVGEQADDEPAAAEADAKKDDAKQAASEQPADQEAATAEAAKQENDAAAKQAADKAPADAKKDEQEETTEEVAKPDPKLLAEAAYNAAIQAHQAATLKYEAQMTAWDTNAKEGKEKVAELSERFSGWYYVISSDSFEKFRLSRNDVVSEKSADAATNPEAIDLKAGIEK